MEENNIIQLKKDNIFRVDIVDSQGNKTGEQLQFDLEDIELPLRLAQCEKMHEENMRDLKAKILIIDKKQDTKGKILSKNEEQKIIAFNECYKKEEEALDLFLGQGGTRKLLNGRKPYLTMYNDIGEILEPIMPKLKLTTEDITRKIKEKYSKKEEDTI